MLINLLSTMQDYNQKKIAGLILAKDFMKAFDSINHSYIQAVIKKFNFGNDICEWINLFLMIEMAGYSSMGISQTNSNWNKEFPKEISYHPSFL